MRITGFGRRLFSFTHDSIVAIVHLASKQFRLQMLIMNVLVKHCVFIGTSPSLRGSEEKIRERKKRIQNVI